MNFKNVIYPQNYCRVDPQLMFRVIVLGKQLYGCLLPDELEDFSFLIGSFSSYLAFHWPMLTS